MATKEKNLKADSKIRSPDGKPEQQETKSALKMRVSNDNDDDPVNKHPKTTIRDEEFTGEIFANAKSLIDEAKSLGVNFKKEDLSEYTLSFSEEVEGNGNFNMKWLGGDGTYKSRNTIEVKVTKKNLK